MARTKQGKGLGAGKLDVSAVHELLALTRAKGQGSQRGTGIGGLPKVYPPRLVCFTRWQHPCKHGMRSRATCCEWAFVFFGGWSTWGQLEAAAQACLQQANPSHGHRLPPRVVFLGSWEGKEWWCRQPPMVEVPLYEQSGRGCDVAGGACAANVLPTSRCNMPP